MNHPQSIIWMGLLACVFRIGNLEQALGQDVTISADQAPPCVTGLILVADASEAAAQPADDPEDVQGRAVPRMAPGMTPAPQLEGGIFDGRRLKAKPGFHVEQQPGNTAMLKPNTGGNGVKLSCRCTKGKGACIMTIETGGTSAFCSPNGCAGDCEMRLTTGAFAPGMRMQ